MVTLADLEAKQYNLEQDFAKFNEEVEQIDLEKYQRVLHCCLF